MVSQLWRTPQELVQPVKRHRTFTFTTSGDTAEDAVSINFEAFKVSFVVDTNDLYIEFDADSTTSSLLIPAGEGYAEEGISFTRRISVINVTAGQNGRIRGIIWGF